MSCRTFIIVSFTGFFWTSNIAAWPHPCLLGGIIELRDCRRGWAFSRASILKHVKPGPVLVASWSWSLIFHKFLFRQRMHANRSTFVSFCLKHTLSQKACVLLCLICALSAVLNAPSALTSSLVINLLIVTTSKNGRSEYWKDSTPSAFQVDRGPPDAGWSHSHPQRTWSKPGEITGLLIRGSFWFLRFSCGFIVTDSAVLVAHSCCDLYLPL